MKLHVKIDPLEFEQPRRDVLRPEPGTTHSEAPLRKRRVFVDTLLATMETHSRRYLYLCGPAVGARTAVAEEDVAANPVPALHSGRLCPSPG
ncbi:MAG TPA: hypothetical protein PKN13_09740 [Accumulibacter sp.]|nr:hypothetical protein [Accumulibacter sp.]HNM75606.1 hypothetical protein [Accumulibacter sp.]